MPAAETGAALARAADIVITMLPTGAIVRDALLGAGGIARSLARGAVVVDMSSSDPNGTRELGRGLAELGVALVDAPVSGGVPRAEAGTLAIMIGGEDEAAIARVRPVLETMGAKLFRTGPLGSGHAMKALNNYVAAAAFAATSEALLVGKRFGLEPAVMVEVMNASSGRSFNTDIVFPDHVVGGKFAAGFALGLMAKDVGIAAGLAREIGVDVAALPADERALERRARRTRRDGRLHGGVQALGGPRRVTAAAGGGERFRRMTAARYTATAITLHWLIALLVPCGFALGLYMVDLPFSPRKLTLYSYHKWIGVTVFALAALRIAWRLTHPPPALPPSVPRWHVPASGAVHFLLYACLVGWAAGRVALLVRGRRIDRSRSESRRCSCRTWCRRTRSSR